MNNNMINKSDSQIPDNIKDRYVRTTVYLTKKLQKALKMKIALSDAPIDKDQSAIIRAALNIYLADILKNLDDRNKDE